MSQRRELSLCQNQPYEIDSESDERKSAADDRKAQKEFYSFSIVRLHGALLLCVFCIKKYLPYFIIADIIKLIKI